MQYGNIFIHNKTILCLVKNTMSEARIKGSGAGDQPLPGMETHTDANEVSKSENINVCQECGGPLRFGSRDPCEGNYYWCRACGAGPILFPLGTGPRPVSGIIDADTRQAAQGIRGAAAAIQDSIVADVKPFNPGRFVQDLVAS